MNSFSHCDYNRVFRYLFPPYRKRFILETKKHSPTYFVGTVLKCRARCNSATTTASILPWSARLKYNGKRLKSVLYFYLSPPLLTHDSSRNLTLSAEWNMGRFCLFFLLIFGSTWGRLKYGQNPIHLHVSGFYLGQNISLSRPLLSGFLSLATAVSTGDPMELKDRHDCQGRV